MDVYEEADLYCGAFAWPLDAEVDFLLALRPGARTVFEPFCGNARYAPHFAARGVAYHGLDLAPAMLSRAPRDPLIHLHAGDASAFRLPAARFDLAFAAVNSVRHLTEEASIVSHLASVRRHLAPGGVYVLELELVNSHGPWTWTPEQGGLWETHLADGSRIDACWRRESCDRRARTCAERATFRHVLEGRVVEETSHVYTMRMWTHDDLLRLTAAGGFRVREAYLHAGEADRPPTEVSRAAENDGQNRYYVLEPTAEA